MDAFVLSSRFIPNFKLATNVFNIALHTRLKINMIVHYDIRQEIHFINVFVFLLICLLFVSYMNNHNINIGYIHYGTCFKQKTLNIAIDKKK